MKKAFVFLACVCSLSLALAAKESYTSSLPLSNLLVKNNSTPAEFKATENKIFTSKYLGHVLYIASATGHEQYVEITLDTPGYSFKAHKRFKGGKRIQVLLSPSNYKPLIIEGPIGHYSYTVKESASILPINGLSK